MAKKCGSANPPSPPLLSASPAFSTAGCCLICGFRPVRHLDIAFRRFMTALGDLSGSDDSDADADDAKVCTTLLHMFFAAAPGIPTHMLRVPAQLNCSPSAMLVLGGLPSHAATDACRAATCRRSDHRRWRGRQTRRCDCRTPRRLPSDQQTSSLLYLVALLARRPVISSPDCKTPEQKSRRECCYTVT